MGKFWARDPRDLTPLEYIHSPLFTPNIHSRRTGQPRPYQYYDTPDGQDADKKMWVVTKWGFGIGTFLGVVDVNLYSNPTNVLQIMNRMAYFVVPFTGMFATYGALTYAATNLRGKDDSLNSLFGGAVAGSLAGVWLKNGSVGLFGAILTGVFCAGRKYAHSVGHEMFQVSTVSRMERVPRSFSHDWSITPVGDKGWTTGKE